jgi:Ca-activated chloride channel homolog
MKSNMRRFVRPARFWILLAATVLAACGWSALRSHAQQVSPAGTAPQQQQRPRKVLTPTAAQPSQPVQEQGQGARPSTLKDDAALMSDDDVVRVETDLTNVLFTAVDRERRFVTDLKKDDVRVLENGVPQNVSIFQRETDLPLSLALLIDTSASEFNTLPDEKSTASSFIDSIIRPDRDHAAVISFTGKATLEQPLTADKKSIQSAINRLQIVLPPKPQDDEADPDASQDPRGYTGIWDAVWEASNEVMSQTPERTRRAIILLTDGDDTSSMTKMQEAIDMAVKSNTVIYAIGIGDRKEYKVEEASLRKLAERTGGRAFFPYNEADLSAAFQQIQLELRSQYLIAYTPSKKASDGSYRQINLEIVNPELRKQKLRLLYRQGYYTRRDQTATQTGPKT